MRQRIIEFKDLQNSWESFEAKIPNFLLVFMYLMILIIIIAFLWVWFGMIDVVITAQGIVRPQQNISVIKNLRTGVVASIHYQDGQFVQKGDLLYSLDSSYYEKQKGNLSQLKAGLNNDLSLLALLEKSIANEQNLIPPTEWEYYLSYLVYQGAMEDLKMEYSIVEDKYLKGKAMGEFISKSELMDLENEYWRAKSKMEVFKTENLLSIKERIRSTEEKLLGIERQLNEVEENIALGHVAAPIDGIIQVIRSYNVGDYHFQGEEILKIIPEDSTYRIQLMVRNEDISKIKLNQEVKYKFLSLPFKEYGVLKGEIIHISSDVTGNTNSYLIEGSLENKELYDAQGTAQRIKAGMLCEVKIVIKKQRIIEYIIEKLDLG